MDIFSIIGLVAGMVFMIASMGLSVHWDWLKIYKAFIDGPSVMITFGGTVASVFIANPIATTLSGMKGAKVAFKPPQIDPMETIRKIIELSTLARKEGVLALDDLAASMEDPFLKKGIMLIVDATDPELVRSILETEMSYIESRHSGAKGIWDYIAGAGPAWGMIGTLIGLILMLQDMSDAKSIGPSMAVALVTTFYGSVIANFVAGPISNKMKIYSEQEMLIKEVQVEGILSIQAGENPRIIEEKLKAFLSPALRGHQPDDEGKPEGGE